MEHHRISVMCTCGKLIMDKKRMSYFPSNDNLVIIEKCDKCTLENLSKDEIADAIKSLSIHPDEAFTYRELKDWALEHGFVLRSEL